MDGQGGFGKTQNTTARCPDGDMDDYLGVCQDLRLRPELAPYKAAVVSALAATNALACFSFDTPQGDCKGVGLRDIVCYVVESQANMRENGWKIRAAVRWPIPPAGDLAPYRNSAWPPHSL